MYGMGCEGAPWQQIATGEAHATEAMIGGIPLLLQWQKTGPESCTARAPGWFLKIRERSEVSDKVPRVTLQAQGTHWATGRAIGGALDDFEGMLTGGILGAPRKPGRTDLCADIWIMDGDPPALDFVEIVTRSPIEHWKTHLRKSDEIFRLLRDGAGHSTRYIGARARLQVRCYRKDIHFQGSTAAAFADMWRALGWDGTGAILRVEFEVHREWMRSHAMDGRRLSDFTLDEWERALPALWPSILDAVSFRPGVIEQICRRTESDLWRAIRAEPFEAKPPDRASLRAAEIRADERELLARINRAVWSGQEAFGDELTAEALRVARAPPGELANVREAWQQRSRWAGHKERKEHDRENRRRSEEEAEREAGPRHWQAERWND